MPIHSCNPYLAPPAWIATINNPLNVYMYELASEVGTDSSNNVYVLVGTNYADDWIGKFDPFGNLLWQQFVGTNSNAANGFTVSPSGDVYVLLSLQGGASVYGSEDSAVVKYDTNGVLQWSTAFGGAANDTPKGIDVDSSDNVYISGDTLSAGAGSADIFTVKFNSSGVLQWQRLIGSALGEGYAGGMAVDGAGGVYVVGDGAGGTIGHVIKYNSSGVLQWQRELYNAFAGGDRPRSAATDSSNNVFVSGEQTQTGLSGNSVYVAKYNSAGVIQWQRTLDASSGGDYTWDMTTDSSGNVYLVGTEYAGYDTIVAKWNGSGVIQWQRSFGGTGSDTGYGITVDSVGSMVFTGRIDYNDAYIMKVPSDGSKTGVYNANGYSVTYAASSFTEVAGDMTDAVASLTDQVGTLSSGSVVVADAVAAYDATLLAI